MDEQKVDDAAQDAEPFSAPARQGPADAIVTWNDLAGTHEVELGPAGQFQPESRAEVEFADSQGWPVIDDAPAPKAQKAAPQPAPKQQNDADAAAKTAQTEPAGAPAVAKE